VSRARKGFSRPVAQAEEWIALLFERPQDVDRACDGPGDGLLVVLKIGPDEIGVLGELCDEFCIAIGKSAALVLMGVPGKEIDLGQEIIHSLCLAGEVASVVSTARLDPQFYGNPANFELLIERALKEAVHETAHMFGLKHCRNPECVMSFSNSVSYVDDKKDDFCRECSVKISMEDIRI